MEDVFAIAAEEIKLLRELAEAAGKLDKDNVRLLSYYRYPEHVAVRTTVVDKIQEVWLRWKEVREAAEAAGKEK